MRQVGDPERRALVALRHGIAPDRRYHDPVEAVRAMTVLHATEPATVYLSLFARCEGLTVRAVEDALHEERSLVKQLAMRRTLFVFPRELLPAAWGSASARVAAQLRPRLAKEVQQCGVSADGAGWLDVACEAVLERLAGGDELSAQALREELPALSGRVDLAVGKAYGANVPIAPRVLGQLGAEGLVVRGRNAGHWRVSRPQWTSMQAWLGELPSPWEEDEGYAALVAAWLRTFGPGTTADLRWWLGATVRTVTRALAAVGAVEVSLDGGGIAWMLPEDLEELDGLEHPAPWAALLPVLDPTVMGWKERGWFLGPHAEAVFDRNGNAGTTAWWDGRVVGCWTQDVAGVVRVHLLEEVPAGGRAALEVEAERLTAWLEGVRIGTVYPSPAMKAAGH